MEAHSRANDVWQGLVEGHGNWEPNRTATAKKRAKLTSYRISLAKSSGFIAINNAIMKPRVPFVIAHHQGRKPAYHSRMAIDQQLAGIKSVTSFKEAADMGCAYASRLSTQW